VERVGVASIGSAQRVPSNCVYSVCAMDAPTIERLLAERVDGRYRGFGAVAGGLAVGELGTQGYDVRRGDLPLPLLTLRERALAHNLALMQDWCARRGLSLAPHGKTTMAPQLIRRQLDAGAWGMTAATVQQLAVMRAAGARRVLLANELAGTAEIAWLARERAADPGFEAFCLVDSLAGVARLDAGLAAGVAGAPLGVLIELGGARAGCRTDAQALALAAAVAASPRLALAGVEGYEGTLGNDREPATLAAVDAFLDRLRALAAQLDARGAFTAVPEILVSAGGSALFDRVAERLRFDAPLSRPVRVVVRAGCYLTHDDGLYARVSPLPALRPAFDLWASVLSCPEPGLAIAGFGKRDAPYDLGLPLVRERLRDGARAPAEGVVVDALNDQHAFLRDPSGVLRVGDVLRCGISHPCTAFDKWALIAVLDDDDVVIDAVRTLF
jgi:D-serine deaminase-like pyridoxal phosphate-dependent protein